MACTGATESVALSYVWTMTMWPATGSGRIQRSSSASCSVSSQSLFGSAHDRSACVKLVQGCFLDSEWHAGDKIALERHLNDPDIAANTLAIPSPYRRADAERWLATVRRSRIEWGQPMHFVIRDVRGALIGAIGLDGQVRGQFERLELGYWLAKPYWGRGIMPAAVRAVCDAAARELGVMRVGALVFVHNARSARVLEKCGFVFEGVLRRYATKHGELRDVKSYAYLPTPAGAADPRYSVETSRS